mgnify:CR=1 FL=1
MKKTRLTAGLTILSSFFLAGSVTTALIMEYYRDPLDEFTDSRSSMIVTEKNEDGTSDYNFKSNFTSGKVAFEGFKNFALKEAEETNVLLKNENNALPLTQDKPKVTLFGLRSYATVYGNNGGSTPDKTTVENGNFADDVFQKYFDVNPSMLEAYENYCNTLTWGGSGFGAKPPSYAQLNDKKGETIYELSPEELAQYNPDYASQFDEYSDAAIVVLGRTGGESYEYYKQNCVDGENPTTTGNYLGLSEEEKEVIELAKEASDKVIVLINSTQVMEFKELTTDPDIDSIMWIGYPGPYGLYKVCETL